MATADEEVIMVMVADMDIEAITTTTQARQLLMLLAFTQWWNGINYLSKSVTRFTRNMTRKVNLVEPSILLVTSPLNMSLPSSVPCSK